MFDELLEREREARADLKRLKGPALLKEAIAKELDEARKAFDDYHNLLQRQSVILAKERDDAVKLSLLDECWRQKVEEWIRSGDPTNRTLLQQRREAKSLAESVECWRLVESLLEHQLDETKKGMFKLEKIAGEIRERLTWQTNQVRAGYSIDAEGVRV